MYDKKLKEYKEKQEDLFLQMEDHSKADENFYITAATVLDLSSRALEIFKSSEVTEKRALLKFLLQNCVLSGRKLLFELKTPFDVIAQYGKTQEWLPGLDDVDNKFTVFWRLYRMALRTGRCGERFQCCLPAERRRINNVVLVCHKGHPALVFLLAKDASLPEPVGTDPLFPHNLGVSQISLDRLGSRGIPLPLLSAFSTFPESEAFLGGPEEKPSKLPRMPLNPNEASSQFCSNRSFRFSPSSFMCLFMASTLERASFANTLPNLKKRVALKVQLSPFGSIVNDPLGQTTDVGNESLYSIFLFGSTLMPRNFILCSLPCKYSST